MEVLIGCFLHLVGGFAAGSFYIPYKKVKGWSWESYWITGGFFSWLVVPWIVALLTVPGLFAILHAVDFSVLFWVYFMGVLWGLGGLTFGLTMRYLGMSIGMSIALGFCSFFGTIIPPLYKGTFIQLFSTPSGLITFAGILTCVIGIVICGRGGLRKERELSEDQKKESIKEFNFTKGLLVAIFSGIMSSCMAFGIAAGKPMADLAVTMHVNSLWKNSSVLVVVLTGGLTTNFIWCLILNYKNKSAGDYINKKTPLLKNYFFAALAGTIWYLQFMFYGMGTTKMGKYDFSSWTLHMAFIIVFSNMWGIVLNEWKGSSKKTMTVISLGIAVILFSTVLIGAGSYLVSLGK